MFRILILAFIICSCHTDHSNKINTLNDEDSYAIYNRHFRNDTLNKRWPSKKLSRKAYTIDNDTITKDSFYAIPIIDLYHTFIDMDFNFIRTDSFYYALTYNAFTKEYYNKNKFTPLLADISLYSDNLIGLNVGSTVKQPMNADCYDAESGAFITSFKDDKYDGSYFIGQQLKNDSFQTLRMILKIGDSFFESTFNKEDIDDRTSH